MYRTLNILKNENNYEIPSTVQISRYVEKKTLTQENKFNAMYDRCFVHR